MSRWKAIVFSIVFDLGWAACGVVGFLYGVSWAENLFKFFAWIALLFKMLILLAIATEPEDVDWPVRHTAVTARTADLVAALVAGAAGWFITATVVMLQWFLGEVCWHGIGKLRDQEPDDDEEEDE